VAAIVGISVGGIIGALAAIPVAGCIKILLEDHFDQRDFKEGIAG
jgi:predicted PurR-regulated permease PerM